MESQERPGDLNSDIAGDFSRTMDLLRQCSPHTCLLPTDRHQLFVII